MAIAMLDMALKCLSTRSLVFISISYSYGMPDILSKAQSLPVVQGRRL